MVCYVARTELPIYDENNSLFLNQAEMSILDWRPNIRIYFT